jgi:hypothetical protein
LLTGGRSAAESTAQVEGDAVRSPEPRRGRRGSGSRLARRRPVHVAAHMLPAARRPRGRARRGLSAGTTSRSSRSCCYPTACIEETTGDRFPVRPQAQRSRDCAAGQRGTAEPL